MDEGSTQYTHTLIQRPTLRFAFAHTSLVGCDSPQVFMSEVV